MFKNTMKTGVLLASLGGLIVAVSAILGGGSSGAMASGGADSETPSLSSYSPALLTMAGGGVGGGAGRGEAPGLGLASPSTSAKL